MKSKVASPQITLPFNSIPGMVFFRIDEFKNTGNTVSYTISLDTDGTGRRVVQLADVFYKTTPEHEDALEGQGYQQLIPTPMHVCSLLAVGSGLLEAHSLVGKIIDLNVQCRPQARNLCYFLAQCSRPQAMTSPLLPALQEVIPPQAQPNTLPGKIVTLDIPNELGV